MFILAFFFLAFWTVVRYRYLTTYSRLPPEEHREEPKIDLFMDSDTNQDSKHGFTTYIEDFLSAIKVFGHLERPVFHELTRQMQTYKLEQGETMSFNESKGFYIVVDGTIQILTKSLSDPLDSFLDHNVRSIAGQNYQVLNEVKRGAPISSLLSVLALFAGTIKTDWRAPSSTPKSGSFSFNQDDYYPDLGLVEPNSAPLSRSNSHSGLHQTPNGRDSDNSFQYSPGVSSGGRPAGAELSQFEQSMAYAAEDSTIAIIPHTAFSRLTRKFPKSAVHIIQVVMSRLSRVTFQTGHNYLGLTAEIYKSEIILNNQTKYELPSYLRDKAINGLKEAVKKLPLDKAKQKLVYLGKPKLGRKKTAGSMPISSPSTGSSSLPTSTPVNGVSQFNSRHVILTPNTSHPGDLLSNVPLSRRESSRPGMTQFASNVSFTGDEETEDSALRVALTECIFKILGLENAVQKDVDLGPTIPNDPSTPADSTPLLTTVDAHGSKYRRQSFNNVFNNLTKMERLVSIADEESVTSSNSPVYENAQIETSQALEVILYKEGSVLLEQNGESHGIFYIIDGFLEVGYHDKSGNYFELYTIKPGGISGFLDTAMSYKSFVEVKAKTDVYVGFLPREVIERISERYPIVLLSIANTLTSILSDLIVTLDFGLEWVQIPQGQVLFKEGDESDAIYIVLNGRLRSVVKQADGENVKHGEYGQGDSIGELEVLTVSKRPYTLHAIRESEVAKLPRSLFEKLARKHPSITIEISRIIASRVRNRLGAPSISGYEPPGVSEFRTVSILPIRSGLPVAEFGQKLTSAYREIGQNVFPINVATALHYLGRHAFNKLGLQKLSAHLADLEEKYETVLYIADSNVNSVWTRQCISQADCILLLANSGDEPEIGEYERLLVTMKTTARTELILLHDERYINPGSTSKWLKNRIWVNSHHHIQMGFSHSNPETPFTATGKLNRLKNKMRSIQTDIMNKYGNLRRVPIYTPSYVHKNDYYRLARILSGQAVGLVLGGGGARGISHIGVLHALEESGIPIDFVGGTSIGAFVGGLYAKEYDIVPIYGRAKKFAARISSRWRMALDLTYPATSYTTGHEFNRGIWKTFGDNQIEDFWLKYFTNTTNITHSRMEIHKAGYAWRYIRASMSLAGLLPPITDKGSMLLDGGYVDNLPVAEMRSQGAKYIFAVDVGSIDDTTPMCYGDSLSGIWVLFNRWNIFSRHPNVPNLAEIQARLAYVSSVGALEKAKATPGVIYLRPPIDNYATLDFAKFDEIYQVGIQYGQEFLTDLKANNKMPQIPGAIPLKGGKNSKPVMTRRNSI